MQRACAVRTPDMVARARALWAQGLSLTAIAERLNTSRPTIKRALAGVAKPRADRMTPAIRAEIHRMHAEGMPKTQIARAVGFAESYVRSVLDDDAEQSAAAGAAHREGGNIPRVAPPALPPNSTELASGRMARPEISSIVSKVIGDRHAREHAARIKAAHERAPVVRKFSNGPFRIGVHRQRMQELDK